MSPQVDEDCRLASLLAFDVLDTEPEPEFDAIVGLVAAFCGTPIALLSLADSDRQFFKARFGLDTVEMPRRGSFCNYAISTPGAPFVVPDARRDPRFQNHAIVVGEPGICFYASVPLVARDGHAIGTLCTLDRVPRTLTGLQLEALGAAGAAVMLLLEKRREHAFTRMLELVNARPSDCAAIVGIAKPASEYCILYVNESFTRLTGYTLSDVSAGSCGRALLDLTHEKDLLGGTLYDRNPEATVRGGFLASHRDGTPGRYDVALHPIVTHDGAQAHHLVAIVTDAAEKRPTDEQRAERGEAAARLAEQLRLNEQLEHDLEMRKRAEASLRSSDELFRQIEENAPIGLALVALSGRFLRVNPALCAITGYSKEALTAMTFGDLTVGEDLAADLTRFEATLAGLTASYEMEMRYLLRDGRTVWVSVHCSLVRDETGAPDYFIRQIQDISGRKAAEQELEIARRDALAATQAKSRFLATMSHEIRTPMNGIIGMTELLSLSPLSDEQRECAEVVRDSGRSLLRVLDDILDYSKVEAGKLDFVYVDFDLAHLTGSIVSLMGPQFREKDLALTLEIAPDVPLALTGDADRVRQVLVNLVGNALKFTPPGGSVRLLVAREDANVSPTLRFTVADTGPGVPADLRSRLFLPFSQLDGSTTRRYGGTGLGLSICKQLVELMGGRIGIDGTGDAGSSFWFSLPFARPAEAAPAVVRGDATRPDATPRRREKVLLAEDNAINVLLAVKQFERLGFEITVVANGKEAVAAIANADYDIVFMDCHMPEMDGLEATRQIRRLPGDLRAPVPIVAMTANVQAEDHDACVAAGMDDYMAKPVGLSDLRAMLVRWLPGGTIAEAAALLPN